MGSGWHENFWYIDNKNGIGFYVLAWSLRDSLFFGFPNRKPGMTQLKARMELRLGIQLEARLHVLFSDWLVVMMDKESYIGLKRWANRTFGVF